METKEAKKDTQAKKPIPLIWHFLGLIILLPIAIYAYVVGANAPELQTKNITITSTPTAKIDAPKQFTVNGIKYDLSNSVIYNPNTPDPAFPNQTRDFLYASVESGKLYVSKVLSGGNTYYTEHFELLLPDNTHYSYQFHPSILKKDILDFTLNDGSKNTAAYKYVFGFDEVLNMHEQYIKDLVIIGTTQEKELFYGFNDPNHPVVQSFYSAYAQDIYAENGEGKNIIRKDAVTVNEFIKNHGIIVYRDALNRYLILSNQNYPEQSAY